MFTRRDFLAMGATGLASIAPAPWQTARSQAIRNSARMLVGFSAGGSVDFVARLLVNEMRTYAPSFIVENRPGATGRIAMDALKNSTADGSAMILTPASIITLFPYIYKSLNYDAFHDVIPDLCLQLSVPVQRRSDGTRRCEDSGGLYRLVSGQPQQGNLWNARSRIAAAFYGSDARAHGAI